jgi:hypothetical protein
MIRFITELCPIIPGPTWLKNKAQPIAAQNVIDYLLAALENRDGQGLVFEIGGPKITTYQSLMESYARARGLTRRFLLLPFIPIEFMAFGIGLMTPVPRPIARALVGGLSQDSVVLNKNAHDVYPVNLIDFDAAAKEALKDLHPHNIERVWDGELKSLNPFKHEGFFIDQRAIKVEMSIEQALNAIHRFSMENFVVESKSDSGVLFRSMQTKHGNHWVEFNLTGQVGKPTCITQTSYFAPHGLMGFLYGHSLHWFCRSTLVKLLNHIQS